MHLSLALWFSVLLISHNKVLRRMKSWCADSWEGGARAIVFGTSRETFSEKGVECRQGGGATHYQTVPPAPD